MRPLLAGATAHFHRGFASQPDTEKPDGTTNTTLVLWTSGPFSSGTLRVSFWSELAGTDGVAQELGVGPGGTREGGDERSRRHGGQTRPAATALRAVLRFPIRPSKVNTAKRQE